MTATGQTPLWIDRRDPSFEKTNPFSGQVYSAPAVDCANWAGVRGGSSILCAALVIFVIRKFKPILLGRAFCFSELGVYAALLFFISGRRFAMSWVLSCHTDVLGCSPFDSNVSTMREEIVAFYDREGAGNLS